MACGLLSILVCCTFSGVRKGLEHYLWVVVGGAVVVALALMLDTKYSPWTEARPSARPLAAPMGPLLGLPAPYADATGTIKQSRQGKMEKISLQQVWIYGKRVVNPANLC